MEGSEPELLELLLLDSGGALVVEIGPGGVDRRRATVPADVRTTPARRTEDTSKNRFVRVGRGGRSCRGSGRIRLRDLQRSRREGQAETALGANFGTTARVREWRRRVGGGIWPEGRAGSR